MKLVKVFLQTFRLIIVLAVTPNLSPAAVHQHLVGLVVLQFNKFSLLKTFFEVDMSSFLIISDLSYLQPLTESNIVVGGGRVSASTNTITAAGLGYAVAGAGAGAIGQTTYTNAQTQTTVKSLSFLNYSKATGIATAYAQTGNQTASSRSSDTSISIVVTSP